MNAQQIFTVWEKASVLALTQASRALREFSGLDFAVEETAVTSIDWNTMAERLQRKVTSPLYVIHLGAQGLFRAHILLLFSDANSQRLVGVMVGEEVSLPLDELGESALAEVGNVVGTAFLNVFSDIFRVVWEPTPPQVRLTTAAALTEDIAPGTTVLLTEAMFQVTGESVFGEIVVIPTLEPVETSRL